MAAPWYGRAGKHAGTTYANAEAAHYLTLALDLPPEAESNERFDLLMTREKVYNLQGNRAAQQVDLAQLADLAGQLAVAQQAQVALRQARYAEVTSDYEAAIAHAQAVIALAEPAGLWDAVAGGYAEWGAALRQQGHYAQAQDVFHHGLTSAQKGQHQEQATDCLHGLGNVAWHLGESAAARNYYEQALAIAQEIGDREGVGITRNLMGVLALQQNQLEPALAHLQAALAIRQELDQPHYVVEDWVGLAKVAFLQDDRAQTASYLQHILGYLEDNPTLAGADDPLRAFHWTWELLVALEQPDAAQHVLTLAAHVIQAFLDKNSDPAVQATYLKQPHHQVLWAAWQKEKK